MQSKLTRRTFLASVALGASFLTANAQAVLDHSNANVRAVVALQNELTPGLMKLENILGTAVGAEDTGRPSLVVYVEREGANAGTIVSGLPKELRGIPVKVELTDKFRAMKPTRKPGGGGGGATTTVSHTARQTPPIQLGVSGGWGYDSSNGYCCGGTLGSLIQVNGVQYILSNYHVLEADIVTGGNNTLAATGQPVIQPGLLDVQCNAVNAQGVGTLVKLGSLPNYNVDVGIARANTGAVRGDGSILQIGPISSQTTGAFINQRVKKAGRTTALTRSAVSGLNATISVTYENECAGGTAFTKTFTGQIVISNSNSSFLKGGDSGSLMVEDVATNPRAVGLLYAGSTSTAIANPINEVLTFVGNQLGGAATMVGK